jgi:hypothetical protein
LWEWVGGHKEKGASFIQQLAPTRLADVACLILISHVVAVHYTLA